MKYKVIYPDDLESQKFDSFEKAMKHINSFSDEDELSLKIVGYSPITLEEALFFCETSEQETQLLDIIHHGATIEEALVNVGITL